MENMERKEVNQKAEQMEPKEVQQKAENMEPIGTEEKADRDLNLDLLGQFRKCSHLQYHRKSRFQGQGRILILLKRREAATQRDLVRITQRRSATLSEQLELMEKAGLLTREKSSEDKRNILLKLTDKGEGMAAEAEAERAETADTLFSLLNGDEKTALLRILKKLGDAWEEETGLSSEKEVAEDAKENPISEAEESK